MRILAVDDDPLILELLKESLRQNGYDDVTTCEYPVQALEMAETGDTGFDCYLLDVMMPEMDGITLCQKLRDLDPDAPIVMISAVSERERVAAAIDAGATDYLSKPFDPVELAARLRSVHRLNRLLVRTRSAMLESEGLRSKLNAKARALASAAFIPAGPDNVVGVEALENYLLRLDRAPFAMEIAEITLNDWRAHQDRLGEEGYERLVARVAGDILVATADPAAKLCHNGHGSFTVVRFGRSTRVATVLELKLAQSLKELPPADPSGEPLEVACQVSRPERLKIWSPLDAADQVRAYAEAAAGRAPTRPGRATRKLGRAIAARAPRVNLFAQ